MDEIRARVKDALDRVGLSRQQPGVLIAVAAIAVAAIGLAVWRWAPSPAAELSGDTSAALLSASAPANAGAAPGGSSEGSAAAEPTAETTTLYVHVVGAVRHAGLYELPPGSRVAEAIEKAGGLLGNAAERGLNLARPVSDGEQIVVPTQDEYEANPSAAGSVAGGPAPGAATAASPSGGAGAAKVNINTADAGQLDSLPGVGPSTAAKIIAEREANGPFRSPDDLARVPGIGPKKLDALKDLVAVQ